MAEKQPKTIVINDKEYTEDQLTDQQKVMVNPQKKEVMRSHSSFLKNQKVVKLFGKNHNLYLLRVVYCLLL